MNNITQANINDGQLDISCNVAISLVHGDTGERETQYYHNRVTRTALMGIIHFIYGDFDVDSSVVHRKAANYTPKYLAIGGTPIGAEPYEPNIGVDIKRLDHELQQDEQDYRILIASRQITNTNSNYITISFRAYIPSEIFQNVVIREAGLFIGETGDNCWSKIAVTRPITKGIHDYVDVLWDVKVKSTGATDHTANTNHITENFGVTVGDANTVIIPVDLDWLELDDGVVPQFGVMTQDEETGEIFENTLADYGLDVDVQADHIEISGTPNVATMPTVTCYYQYETLNSNKKLYITLNGTVSEQEVVEL